MTVTFRALAGAALLAGAPALLSLAAFPEGALAQPATPMDADRPATVKPAAEVIEVIGVLPDRFDIAGSATILDQEALNTFEYGDVLRLLRQVPGVNLQEEDGFGLRPNIGLRGTGTDRSEKITLMEDGVLIAPAPYAAPAAYYFPTVGRMEAVEVVKGPSAIRFGPRTIGGAINFVSRQIPDSAGPSGFVEARVGEDASFAVHAAGGMTSGPIGIVLETFQSGSDGFKTIDGLPDADTGFRIEDYLIKLRLSSGETSRVRHSLELKGSATNNDSNETYLGLTDEDFAADPFRRYAASARDAIDTFHWQVQGTYRAVFSEDADLTVTAYYNDFERDWFKLDDIDFGDERGRFRPSEVFADPEGFADVIAVLRGEADSPEGAFQNRHNSRTYYSAGVQVSFRQAFETGPLSHQIETSLRYHEDEEDRFQNRELFTQISGALVPAGVTPPGSQANRTQDAEALAGFIQNSIRWGRVTVTPGVRVEHITLRRTDFSTDDPTRAGGATGLRENTLTIAAPGIDVSVDVIEGVRLIAGVHRGINPPGASDSNAEAETAINVEAGALFDRRLGNGLITAEVIGFYSDVENLIGTCTASRGCGEGEFGDQFNAGAADVRGLELSVLTRQPLGGALDGMGGLFQAIYTFTDSEFKESFEDGFFGEVIDGDTLPFVPRHQLTLITGLEGPRWSLQALTNYVSDTRTKAGQGAIPTAELVEARTVVDLAGTVTVADDVRLFAEVLNLFDNEYAVARQPYGLRPGRPRTVFGGVAITF